MTTAAERSLQGATPDAHRGANVGASRGQRFGHQVPRPTTSTSPSLFTEPTRLVPFHPKSRSRIGHARIEILRGPTQHDRQSQPPACAPLAQTPRRKVAAHADDGAADRGAVPAIERDAIDV